ncbi:MAG: lysophospholipid acyltransferase family protein [Selenomonadaceae bacterium]|nr:lysophospholipid acyltransferase family protein [Selenomonadaceae bacterium]
MSYYIAMAVSRLACLLPSALCEVIGRFLGEIAWPLIPPKRKKMAMDNIKRCLQTDDKEARRIAKASTVRFGPMLMEVLRFPVIKKRMAEYVTIEGLEHLKEGLSLGGGIVIAAAHSGNWELMGGALAQNGIPLVGVAMKQKSADSDRFINEYRALIGMHITYKTGVREMFDFLGKGWAIGLIMDQDTNKHDGIVLNFFGEPTNTTPGAASMARFRDVPLYSAFMHRLPDGTHKLIVGERIEVPHTADKKGDIRKATQVINDRIEEHVRRYPEEWFWLHDRWKSIREEF